MRKNSAHNCDDYSNRLSVDHRNHQTDIRKMTDIPTNVINMQARARLIREAQAAREKRRRDREEAGRDRKGDPDFPGIPELAHFYKPPGTCEICGSISAPGAKVCLTCAISSEVNDMGV